VRGLPPASRIPAHAEPTPEAVRPRRTYTLDTNVLLCDPNALSVFDEHDVVVPVTVIEGLDRFKKDPNETGRNARWVGRRLDALRRTGDGSLSRGICNEGGGRVKVVMPTGSVSLPVGFGKNANDNAILQTVLEEKDNQRCGGQSKHQHFLDRGLLQVEPLTYIRGRSLPHQYMLVDEAQNLTPHEVRTVVSCAGEGTKIILTGDPYQIDNPYVDATSSGLSHVVERFKNSPLAGHVTLTKGERSELAELATKVL
jgi:predicted ribonuclease YlaK